MRDETRPSVLFVCMGNICRSPTGEGVPRDLVKKRGLTDAVEIDSAGTIGHHTGNPAGTRMRAAAARRGYDLASRARQVTREDLERFDLVVAMDRANYDDLVALHPARADRVRMLGSFLTRSERRGFTVRAGRARSVLRLGGRVRDGDRHDRAGVPGDPRNVDPEFRDAVMGGRRRAGLERTLDEAMAEVGGRGEEALVKRSCCASLNPYPSGMMNGR